YVYEYSDDSESYVYEYSDDSEYAYEYSDDYEYDYEYSDDDYEYNDEEYAYQYYDENTGKIKNIYRTGITMESYKYVFLDPAFSHSMWWTAVLTIICTIVSLTMTILCAYPLTYPWLKGKGLINTLIIFTMYFSAGTIPSYILMK